MISKNNLSIEIKNLYKTYKQRKIIQDLSFKIEPQEILGILGPNGAGKTTCFNILAGLVSPDSGKIMLGDLDISQEPIHLRAKLGLSYLSQESSVFRNLSVADNIMAILEMRFSDKLERKTRLEQLIREFSLEHITHSLGLSLSGGERRRVEIARTIALEPKFIMLDEPFAGVDPIAINDIKKIINYLRGKGIGIIITDHNVRETLAICDRALIMNQGKIIAQGQPEEILANPLAKELYLGNNFLI